MAIEARFFVQEIIERAGAEGGQVTLVAASRGPYQDWSKYTPSGNLTMHVTVPETFEWFRAHKGRDVGIRIYDLDDHSDYIGPHQAERA